MLTRRIARFALILAAAALLPAALQSPAVASGAGNPGSGGPWGGVQCGQSYSPGCTVTAVTPPGSGGGQPRPGGPVATGAGAAGGCAGSTNAIFGCVPPGCQVTVQTLFCPVGVPGAAGPGAVPPAPGVLAARARALLVLPRPVIGSSPPPGRLQLARLPTWLWVRAVTWVPQSRTAAVPGESVTATATPAFVTWRMGDGSIVTCHGPGVPYTVRYSPVAASPDCGYIYSQSSAGEPGGAYRVTVTITWDITWTGPGGTGGALAPLHTVAAAEFRVAESQALNTSGG